MLFIEYPKCSTSNKAKKWMKDHGFEVELRNIKEDNPSFEELKEWHKLSGLDIKRFFNTSGELYREQGIKDIIKTTLLDELLQILSQNGMMVKRPILVHNNHVLVGFKEEEWKQLLL